MTRAYGSRYFFKIWDHVGEENDSDVLSVVELLSWEQDIKNIYFEFK